ncbi:MAG: LPS assembly lipoprotein LptE [Phenylobacterium sp.]
MARARTYLALAAALGASLLLGGCGFTPLYAAPGVNSKLAAINVTAPEGRTGFLIRQHLDDAFAKNHNAPAEYSMRLALAEARYPRGIRTDNVASRYEYVLTADYVLAAVPSGEVVKRGRVRAEVTYDSPDQPYGSIAEEQDAADRVAQEAARRIQLEVAAWMATGEPHSKTAPKVLPPPANSVTPTGLPAGD